MAIAMSDRLQPRLVQLAVILGFLLTLWWLLVKPGFDSGAAYLVAASALFGLEWPKYGHGGDQEGDAQLSLGFQKALPYIPAIAFLATHDFGAPFLPEDVFTLDDFLRNWSDPTHEFD